MEEPFLVLGIAGSLRRASWNRGLLRAAIETAPEGVVFETFDIASVPPYDQDVDQAGPPEPVRRLKARIAAARAVLIATPEYNYSVPGTLKNALDWASRPAATTPLRHKAVAIMGATGGGFGTVRAQLALRQVFLYTETHCMLKPELMVSGAAAKFDADGNLLDAEVREKVRAHVRALVAWTRQVEAGLARSSAPG